MTVQLYKIFGTATLSIAVFLIIILSQTGLSQEVPSLPYIWKSVQIVGGGFIDGIVFHQTAKGVCYCRTDIGGAYRRNEKTKVWEPLSDWISYEARNCMGVESITLDPSDPERVFLACGTYTLPQVPNGVILRSNDRGKTFQRTDMPFKMGANENGRGNGERMAVDPNDGNVLFLGTRNAGLWKSSDRAVTWNKVDSFPDVTEQPPAGMQNADSLRFWHWMNQGCGINIVLFDQSSSSQGKACSTIYISVSLINRANLFRSTDAGRTWQAVPGQPMQYRPVQAALTSIGTMYLTYGNSPGPSRMTIGGVWKLNTKNDTWKEITPDKPEPSKSEFGYAGISVDATNPQVVITSTYHRYEKAGGEEIFRSLNGGMSWKPVFAGGGLFDYTLAPYISHTGIHWMFDLEIDPFDPNHAMCTAGYGGHETFNLSDMDAGKPTKWCIMSTGIEETVALELLSPPKGAHLISAIGDYAGFVHWDLDKPCPEGNFDNPRFGNTNGIVCAESNPDIIVRVGRATNNNPGKHIGYSLNGGKTWQPTVSLPTPESTLGNIAVSTDGKEWIWSPDPVINWSSPNRKPTFLPVFVTMDNGISWIPCQGIPNNTRVIADKVNPKMFYAIDLFAGKLFLSENSGFSFSSHSLSLPGGLPSYSEHRGDSRGGQDRIYATPGNEGDLWIAAFDGLYHSQDHGKNFVKLNGVEEIHGFGFGKAAPGKEYSTLYLIGVVKGVYGIFRSDDIAKNWIRINDNQHQWGLLFHITGDPKKYGRVYVGTHGRGIVYGDPQ